MSHDPTRATPAQPSEDAQAKVALLADFVAQAPARQSTEAHSTEADSSRSNLNPSGDSATPDNEILQQVARIFVQAALRR